MASIPKQDKAAATKIFTRLFASSNFEEVLVDFQEILAILKINPLENHRSYDVLKASLLCHSAENIFKVLDAKMANPIYERGYCCKGLKVAVVGGGPCGLRLAIEARFMGAHAFVMEKRTSFTRNNVLHIWPFVIEDLKSLGVKVFFPKFCTGSMNHISIRRLQLVLLKVSLLMGVVIIPGTEFVDLRPPAFEGECWRVRTKPEQQIINEFPVDVVIGAEGKRVTIPGFQRKEFRGKLAIAITANFVNSNTTPEAIVEEISGVAFLYKQDFFNSLYEELGIALENIVYYKDETHYFVMTTKKHSLLDRSVLKKDYKDPVALLAPSNVNKMQLLEYIRDTCDYCTDYQLPNLKFAMNQRGEPDVALFDFTAMYAARNAIKVHERKGSQLLSMLVGDSLMEPFWPTGTGAARGFLGVLDSCWIMRQWCSGVKSVLQLLAERETLYRLLPQTTPENLCKDFKKHSIDPLSRYPNIPSTIMTLEQLDPLLDAEDPDRHCMMPTFSARAPLPKCGVNYEALNITTSSEMRSNNKVEETSASAYYQLRVGNTAGGNSPEARQKQHSQCPMLATNQERRESNTFKRERGNEKPARITEAQKKAIMSNRSPSRKNSLTSSSSTSKITDSQKRALMTPAAPPQRKKSEPAPRRVAASGAKKSPSSNSLSVTTRHREPKKEPSPLLGDGIDLELDDMLFRLEDDDEFQKLSDNEKMTWLESLFYQDTKHLCSMYDSSSSRMLKKAPPKQKAPLRVNEPTTPKEDLPQPKPSAVIESANNNTVKPQVNAKMVSLAQSFFNAPPGGGGPKKAVSSTSINRLDPIVSVPLSAPAPAPERVSFVPKAEMVEEEEDPINPFLAGRKLKKLQIPSRSNSMVDSSVGTPSPSTATPQPPSPSPPAPPPRSGQTKTAMLRLMSSATSILKK